MIRAFVALPLPEPVSARLAMAQALLPIARPVPRESFHLTLAFLGEQPEDRLEDVHAGLEAIAFPPFTLRIDGLGVFGGDRPRSVHATLAPEPLLDRLQSRIARAVAMAGARLESRRFTPHVTLGRFAPGEGRPEALAHAIGRVGAFAPPPWTVDHFALMRSRLRPEGAVHDELARYPLTG